MSTEFEEAKELLDYTLDVFGGTDGGVSFCIVKENLENCIKKANTGDPIAQQLLLMFVQYDKLLKSFSQPVQF